MPDWGCNRIQRFQVMPGAGYRPIRQAGRLNRRRFCAMVGGTLTAGGLSSGIAADPGQ